MIKIITDSAADFTLEEANALNIHIVPMHIQIGDKEYLDAYELTNHEFFNKLIECNDLPKTSQITPFAWSEAFNKFKGDQVICITMSKKLSGTYNNAYLASQEFKDVKVIDSENVTCGENILVRLAVKLANENKSLDEIESILNEKKLRIRLIAMLDTLKYLYKGGRVSRTTAFFGNLLNIKPVIAIQDGKVAFLGKARGSKQGHNYLRQIVNEGNGIDFNLPVSLAYSGLSDEVLIKYTEDSKDLYEGHEDDISKILIGSTIGTHIGPNSIAVAYFEKEDVNQPTKAKHHRSKRSEKND